MTESPVDVAAIKAALSKSTPGPWKVWGMSVQTDRSGTGEVNYDEMIANTQDPDRGLRTFNANAICSLRNNAEALLDELDRLRAASEGVEMLVAQAERRGAVKALRNYADAMSMNPTTAAIFSWMDFAEDVREWATGIEEGAPL